MFTFDDHTIYTTIIIPADVEWYKPNSCLDFPIGGSQAMADALARCGHRQTTI